MPRERNFAPPSGKMRKKRPLYRRVTHGTAEVESLPIRAYGNDLLCNDAGNNFRMFHWHGKLLPNCLNIERVEKKGQADFCVF